MELLNLNHTEYSDKELEDILSLSYPYQRDDIILQKNIMVQKMTSDSSTTTVTKRNITKFLDDISDRLTGIISTGIQHSQNEQQPKFGNTQNYVNETDGHFIIENKQREREAYTASTSDGLNIGNSGGAPSGIINPISHTTIKRAVNIDSRFRPNYYNTNSTDQKIDLPYRFENVISMRLASIELPLTYHTVSKSKGNNTFLLNWDLSSNGVYENSMVVRIPDGNYDTNLTRGAGSTIESAINAGLQNPKNQVRKGKTMTDDLSFNLIYTVDKTSGRSVFAVDVSNSDITDPSGVAYQLIWAVGADGNPEVNENISFFLGWMLGYRVNAYTSVPSDTITEPPASIISEGICYIKGPSYIFVAIDDYNNNVNNYYISAYSDSINNRNIIARINLASIQQSNGSFQTGEDDGFSTQINRSRNYFGPVNIEKLRITLYDEYGRILSLNNMDWSCALMFECVYSS
jgi:hypothetical protein